MPEKKDLTIVALSDMGITEVPVILCDEMDAGATLQVNVGLAKSDELRQAQTSLNREQQQDPISSAQPRRLIRHGQESLNLGPRQKIH
jgi:hypothetical protein